MPTMSICRLLLPNKEELYFFHIHFYTLYKKCTSLFFSNGMPFHQYPLASSFI